MQKISELEKKLSTLRTLRTAIENPSVALELEELFSDGKTAVCSGNGTSPWAKTW